MMILTLHLFDELLNNLFFFFASIQYYYDSPLQEQLIMLLDNIQRIP